MINLNNDVLNIETATYHSEDLALESCNQNRIAHSETWENRIRMIAETFLLFWHPKSDVIQLSKVLNHLSSNKHSLKLRYRPSISNNPPPPALRKGELNRNSLPIQCNQPHCGFAGNSKTWTKYTSTNCPTTPKTHQSIPTDTTVTRSSPLALLSFRAQRIQSSDWNNLLILIFLCRSCFKIVCSLTMLHCTTSSLPSNRVTIFFSAYASDYDDILQLLLSKKIHLNDKDQLDPLKTCTYVIEPHDQRPLMTLPRHPERDVFFLTLILSSMTLFLFIVSRFSKP